MASNTRDTDCCPKGDKKLTAAIFGTYFAGDLAKHLFNVVLDDLEITPEWEPEKKNAHALRIQELFDTLHILCPTDMYGPSYEWCMGYLRELLSWYFREPRIV